MVVNLHSLLPAAFFRRLGFARATQSPESVLRRRSAASFSRAADENSISQSGASQLVQQLEDHLGVRLIDRSKRPFVMTPEGDLFYDGSAGISFPVILR
ncbi:MAG: LysR family transcriptional regulator [Pirellulales bacterium]